MNTIIRLFLSLAPCALLFSCVKEDAILQQPEVREVKTYSLAVSAVKGERPDTKALKFDGQALKSVWAEGESVRVLKGNQFLGTLHATTAGDETTLSGTISGTLSVDDALTLEFMGPYYTYQKGTLDYIATHCDYATATVSVTSIEGGKVTTDAAHFKNQQAIVKFVLIDKADGTTPLSARSLGVTVGGAITKNVSDDNASPRGGGGLFNYDGAVAKLTGVTITGNEAKVHGGGGIFNIGKLSLEGCTVRNNTARDSGGGVWHGDDHVSGLELNMQGMNLITDNIAGGITGNLFLTGHRKITCTGSLEGSRIGGGDGKNGGTVIINDGHVEAYGGTDAAGIGGEGANGGFVKIHGGYVYAEGNSNGSGIGAREDGNGGEITIDITSGNPLYVEAVGGSDISIWAGSIGSNDSGKVGTLNISNGVKTETYNYNGGYWETVKVENHPVTYVHERRKAVLFTCDHAGYTAATCPYCKHD